MPGIPNAQIVRPGATHEILLFALNPKTSTQVQRDNRKPDVLLPPNFVGQIVAASDQEAISLIDQTVIDICDGKLNPDTDWRSQWIERFGDFAYKED